MSGLRRTTGLKRTALSRGTSRLARRVRLRPMSAKRQAQLPDRDRVRSAVIYRDGGCVLRGGQWARFPRCHGLVTYGHLRNASQVGAFTEDGGVALCVLHNDESENWPFEACLLGIKVMLKPGAPASCMAKSEDGHICALAAGHTMHGLGFHYGGSPWLPEVEWVRWPA